MSFVGDFQQSIYSTVLFIFLDKAGGVADLNQFHWPTKFFSEKISSPNILSWAISFSSIEMKITPPKKVKTSQSEVFYS